VSNALAYNNAVSITTVKSFMSRCH